MLPLSALCYPVTEGMVLRFFFTNIRHEFVKTCFNNRLLVMHMSGDVSCVMDGLRHSCKTTAALSSKNATCIATTVSYEST